jgi:hypothetical protein
LTLEQQLQHSRIAQWDANEQKLLQELTLAIPKTSLTPDVLGRIDLFGKWCEARGVRKCPVKPWVLATYLLEKSMEGIPAEPLLATLAAVADLHDYHGLSNPSATRVVNLVLEKILREVRQPRWSKDELIEWRHLPLPVRNAIARRENDRDQELRRLQNKVAKEVELLRSSNNTETKLVHSNEKDQTHDEQIST